MNEEEVRRRFSLEGLGWRGLRQIFGFVDEVCCGLGWLNNAGVVLDGLVV